MSIDNATIYSNLNNLESSQETRSKILNIIYSFPGIRYRDILRMTNLNNGTLSHHLTKLEKRSYIQISRLENSNITRYYPSSTPLEETIILNYLKIKTTRQIVFMLYEKNNGVTFNEIVTYINKAPSTTSWHIKRLMDSEIVIKKKGLGIGDVLSKYYLDKREIVKKLNQESNKTVVDRSIDNYVSLIDDL